MTKAKVKVVMEVEIEYPDSMPDNILEDHVSSFVGVDANWAFQNNITIAMYKKAAEVTAKMGWIPTPPKVTRG